MSEDDADECFALSCTGEPKWELRYDESGTPVTYEVACTEHKNMECIHDPFNVTATRLDD